MTADGDVRAVGRALARRTRAAQGLPATIDEVDDPAAEAAVTAIAAMAAAVMRRAGPGRDSRCA